MRIDRGQLFLRIAFLMAKRGNCKRAKVGAIITSPDNRIISSGYNGPVREERNHCSDICNIEEPCIRAVHAEANAIYSAAKHGISLHNATLYCTHQPCIKCAEAIIQSGIAQVVYSIPYRDNLGLLLLGKSKISLIQLDVETENNN